MMHPTLDWDSNTGELGEMPDAKEYSVPYAEAKPKGKQYGMRITVDAFHRLLQGALQTHAEQKRPGLRFVEFSKASLFRVLSQPGCEYVRFYFVYPEKNKMSLVLEGVDANLKALKFDSHVMKMAAVGGARAVEADDPVYEEKGNNESSGIGNEEAATVSATTPTPRGAAKKSAKSPGQDGLAGVLKAINTRGAE